MNTIISVRANEHRYFLTAAVALSALVVWAFSFEYGDLIHPSQFTLLVQLHGLVMFTWVGLFLTQVALIVWHRPLWHRRLGVTGMAVAVLTHWSVPQHGAASSARSSPDVCGPARRAARPGSPDVLAGDSQVFDFVGKRGARNPRTFRQTPPRRAWIPFPPKRWLLRSGLK